MEKDGLIDNIRKNLVAKRSARTIKQLDKADRRLLRAFKDVEATKDVGLTLKSFGAVLRDTEKHHINSLEIAGSTANALREWKGATNTLTKIYSPESYRCVEEEHTIPKRMVKERPNDQVRTFLTAQMARLRNECKVVSSNALMGLRNVQIGCLRTAEKEYIKLQDKAMGREPELKKSKSRGMER